MAKITVTTADGKTVYSEDVLPIHMHDDHASLRIIERIAWAVEDADSPQLRLLSIH